MPESIDESVSVSLLNNTPKGLAWRGRRYLFTKLCFHHTVREGRSLLHIYSVTDGANFFKLQLDTETLTWKLLEVDNGL